MNATQLQAPAASDRETNVDPGAPFIHVMNLSKVFTAAKSRSWKLFGAKAAPSGFRAVDDVSFQVERGQIFVIMGLSGSGKSTIIRMLNQLIDATEGTITVDNKDVLAMDPAQLREYRNRTINMVFQHFGLFPHKSLLDNVAFGLKVRGVDRRAREEKAAEALTLVGLGDRIHAMPDQLSGGMRQRVGLARALATDAEILLMDEPFSALDPLIRKDMQDLLVKLQRNFKKTIVFVTHDLNEAMRLGDRIMVMKQGKMIQNGTALDLLDSPADPYIEKFVAEVDRSKVLTARMLVEATRREAPLGTGTGIDEPDNCAASVGAPARVWGNTLMSEILPIFAEGAEWVDVVEQNGAMIGRIRPQDVFAAMSPKEHDHES
jgi:glycine betaine/proline transport system ATP-binding protein